jgi:hypothetical protein
MLKVSRIGRCLTPEHGKGNPAPRVAMWYWSVSPSHVSSCEIRSSLMPASPRGVRSPSRSSGATPSWGVVVVAHGSKASPVTSECAGLSAFGRDSKSTPWNVWQLSKSTAPNCVSSPLPGHGPVASQLTNIKFFKVHLAASGGLTPFLRTPRRDRSVPRLLPRPPSIAISLCCAQRPQPMAASSASAKSLVARPRRLLRAFLTPLPLHSRHSGRY